MGLFNWFELSCADEAMSASFVAGLFGRQVLERFLVVSHLTVIPTLHDGPLRRNHHIALALSDDNVELLLSCTVEIDAIGVWHS